MKPARLPANASKGPPVTVQESGVRRSLTALPTSEVTLRPSLVDALHAIAPRPRRSMVRYVLGVAVLGLLVWMVATPSIRELIVARGRQLVSRQVDAPAADVPSAAAVAPLPAPPPPASVAATPGDSVPVVAAPSVTASVQKLRRPPHR